MSIDRLTIDMLGPIPQGRIRTEATIVRPGKRIELVEDKLWADDRLAVTATAWRMRSTPENSAEVATTFDTSSVPEPQEQKYFPGISCDWGYGRAIEWRFVIVADSANGVSAAVPFGEWTFIPPTLSLTFAREPQSEWLNMNVRTHVGPDCRGVVNGDLAGEIGYVGAVTQRLLIARL
uniref:acyl-CoA thioesterase domain-containing protein n=1 Tax=Brevibacterium siliguriense TaxID=1136497 RepID=UPI000AB8632F|nr:acyl-CoA thioesterase domain-containing protein [Brevibacterium siliguriense]